MVESLGGEIHVESKENRWTKFKFTIASSQINQNFENEERKEAPINSRNLLNLRGNFLYFFIKYFQN